MPPTKAAPPQEPCPTPAGLCRDCKGAKTDARNPDAPCPECEGTGRQARQDLIKINVTNESLAMVVQMMARCLPDYETTCATDADESVDLLLAVDTAHKMAQALESGLKECRDWMVAQCAEHFVNTNTQSVNRGGKLIYLTQECRPTPRIDDLLPKGEDGEPIDPKDPRYKTTVESVKEAARARVVQALKDSTLSHLVEETYNFMALKGALAGEEAQRDRDTGVIIMPDGLEEVIDLNETPTVRVKAAPRRG
jgi:hypothetical protein